MMPESNVDETARSAAGNAEPLMPAEYGLPMATFVIVASMVGSGVLTTSGFTMLEVGSNAWMLLLWTLGGLTAICGALTLAELSAALPKTGGDYVYLHEAYGPLPAFLSGWVSFVIGFAAPAAATASGSASYLLAPWRSPGSGRSILEPILATVLILGFAVIHVLSRRQSSNVQGWITAIKLVVLGGFAIVGLIAGWPHLDNLADLHPAAGPPDPFKMLSSLVYISYAYVGWNAASYLAGEIRDSQRLLPRAILIGTGGVMVLYLAVNAVYAMALTPADIRAIIADAGGDARAVTAIAELAANRLFGKGWSEVLSVAAGLMLLSSLSAYLLIGPRVIYAMATAGQFPAIAARLTPRARTPAIATAFQVAVALVLPWIGSVQEIILYAGVGLSIFSMLSMSSIYVLRRTRPDLPRPFRTPGYPVTPAIFLVLTGMMTLAAFGQHPTVSIYSLLSILAGVPIYYAWQWSGNRSRPTPEQVGS